jgi:hypothetical protein
MLAFLLQKLKRMGELVLLALCAKAVANAFKEHASLPSTTTRMVW